MDERNSLVNRFSPSFLLPTLFSSNFSFLEIRKLPEVVDGVKVSYLNKPRAHALHYLTSGLQAASPVGLPLEEISGMECV